MSEPRRGMIAPKATRKAVSAFFKSVLDRRFSEADRAMNEIGKKRFSDEEFKSGYLNALEGILLSIRSGDERDFVNKAPFDKQSMVEYKRRFGEFSEGIHAPFDTGYFSAWTDFLQYRLRSEGEG